MTDPLDIGIDLYWALQPYEPPERHQSLRFEWLHGPHGAGIYIIGLNGPTGPFDSKTDAMEYLQAVFPAWTCDKETRQ